MAFNFNLFYGRRLFPSLTSHIINKFVLKIGKWESMYLWEGTLFGNREKLAFNIEGNTSFRRRQMQRVFPPRIFNRFLTCWGWVAVIWEHILYWTPSILNKIRNKKRRVYQIHFLSYWRNIILCLINKVLLNPFPMRRHALTVDINFFLASLKAHMFVGWYARAVFSTPSNAHAYCILISVNTF